MNYFGLFVLAIVYAEYVMNYSKLVTYVDGIVKKYLCARNESRNDELKNDDEPKDVNTWYMLNEGRARYKGEWKNGVPHGEGTYEYLQGTHSIIEGTFIDGYAEGYGIQIFDREYEKMVPYYKGEFHRNLQHGQGEYHYGNGSYYKGEFRDGKFHGQGSEYCHIKKQTFVGKFANDGQLEGTWKQ